MSNSVSTTPGDRAVLLTRYKENCDQARHHEALRERTTSMVAQTVGVLLGLIGFKEGTWENNPIGKLIAIFIILLGAWGVFSSLFFESRIRRHRKHINNFVKKLESTEKIPDNKEKELESTKFISDNKEHKMIFVWVLFHAVIISLGIVLLVKI